MVSSTEKLLSRLHSDNLDTNELFTVLNTLLSKKKQFENSNIETFKLSSTVLNVVCLDSKWALMDQNIKNTCAQLLASDTAMEILVKNIKNGLDNIGTNNDIQVDKLSFDIKTGLDMSGTNYLTGKHESGKKTNDDIKTQIAEGHNEEFTIKSTSTTLVKEESHKLLHEQQREIQTKTLYLPVNKETATIQLDILILILKEYMDELIDNFLNFKNKSSARFKDFKSLLSIKINDILGYALVQLMDEPSIFTIGLLRVEQSDIKSIMESYSSKLMLSLLNSYNEPNIVVCEIIAEFLRRDNSFWTMILSNWSIFLSSIPKMDILSRRETNQLKTINYVTSQLFTGSLIKLPLVNEWMCVVKSWIDKLSEIGISKQRNYELIYKLCAKSDHPTNCLVWVTIINYVNYEWVKKSINNFGSKEYITNTPLKNQRSYALLILFLISKLSKSKVNELSTDRLFLNAISNRLESKIEEFRFLGMFIADEVAEIGNGKPLFTVNGYLDKRIEFKKSITNFELSLKDIDLSLDQAIEKIVNEGKSLSTKATEENIIQQEKPLIMQLDYESDADDSDLEDTSIPRRPHVSKPVYLKDLLDYLTCGPENDKKAHYKKGIAFSIAIEMVRLKRGSTELAFYTEKLFDSVFNLNDIGFPDLPPEIKSNTSKAEALNIWRISFMIAIIVSSPDTSFTYLFKCFLENDISTPRRVQILSAIGFACRELCGKDEKDSFIWGKNNDDKVKPKKLNNVGHEEFKMLDSKIQELSEGTDDQKLALESDGDYINSGTVLRRSRKLQIDKENRLTKDQLQKKNQITSYINRGLPKVFYSMISIWHEVNSETHGRGFLVGKSMGEILNAHYLSILSMVFKCALPSCVDIIEMSREMLNIVKEQLFLIDAGKEFQHLLFGSVSKCLSGLVLENENVIKILLSSQVMDIVEVLNTLTTIMNENSDTITDIISLSIAAKVILELQDTLKKAM